jgi:hypothetical protein
MSKVAIGSGTVPTAAEWALWGKTPNDRGYRLLNCSNGSLSPNAFIEVLTRYSPGTLERLPQVTVSWSAPPDERSYVAIAIHEKEEHGLYDADGREIVFTRYFCVPYEDLAIGEVSYLSMYEKFSKFTLQAPDRAPIKTDLTSAPPTVLHDYQALRIAALLLTCKPVCIVGADGTDFRVRLQFLDTVMSMLPYGMRSRLSASTWVSSTMQTHKFRLFFASAPRPIRDDQQADHIVKWGRQDHASIGHCYADDYLRWLERQVRQPTVKLAVHKQQIDFSPREVLRMLEMVGVPSEGPVLPVYSYGQNQAASPTRPVTLPTATMTADELIIACGEYFGHPNPEFIAPYIEALRSFPRKPGTPEECSYYQQLIKRYQLLTENPQIDAQLATKLYDALLPMAFDGLTYANFCEIEAWTGIPEGKSLHQPLLESLAKAAFKDVITYLLVVGSLGDKRFRRQFPENAEFSQLIELIANSKVPVHHARILCDAAIQFLRERAVSVNRQSLQSVLSRHGYLAPLLEECYSHSPEYQRAALIELVGAAHGRKLDAVAIGGVFGNATLAPTAALLAAVLGMVGRQDIERVLVEFSRGLLDKTAFADETRWQLTRLLPPADQTGMMPGMDQTASADAEVERGVRGRIERWRSHLPSRSS